MSKYSPKLKSLSTLNIHIFVGVSTDQIRTHLDRCPRHIILKRDGWGIRIEWFRKALELVNQIVEASPVGARPVWGKQINHSMNPPAELGQFVTWGTLQFTGSFEFLNRFFITFVPCGVIIMSLILTDSSSFKIPEVRLSDKCVKMSGVVYRVNL